jgi:hypothetical protein
MDGQQVGKTAISGWRDLLTQAPSDPNLDINIWPFSGSLAELYQPGASIVVETYHTEFYTHLGLSFSSSNRLCRRRCSDCKAFADLLISWGLAHKIDLDPSMVHAL